MTKILDEKIREQIKEFLPRALARTMKSYEDFVEDRLTENQKENFAENHKNANLAIKHIEVLVKLAGIAEIPDATGDGMELAALLQQASAEMDKYQERQE